MYTSYRILLNAGINFDIFIDLLIKIFTSNYI